MCARPRRISDEEIFAAALRAMSRLPPSELTLAAIGAEAGVTAGALVQRFGSKRALQLALARAGAEGEAALASDFLAQHGSPLRALEAYARCMTGLAESPAAFQRGLPISSRTSPIPNCTGCWPARPKAIARRSPPCSSRRAKPASSGPRPIRSGWRRSSRR